MHFVKIIFFAVVLIGTAGTAVASVEIEVNAKVNFGELNDYGEWVIVPGYGTVWRPDVDPEWRPFVYGHWIYSSDGWVWNSDEPVGWIVCHYGSWFNDRDQGWVWVPGYDWSPARVRWYVSDREIGWAPLEPEPRSGYRGSRIRIQWSFTPITFFSTSEVRSHLAFRDEPVRVSVSAGPPRREFVQRYSAAPVVTVRTNKVDVTTRVRPLVRLEVQSHEQRSVVVPIGPRYKRVTIESAPPPDRSSTVRPREQTPVTTSPKVNVRTNSGSSRENQDDQNRVNDDKAKKKKITIQMKE